MNVFYIQFERTYATGHRVWMLFETDHAGIAELSAALNSGFLVHGFELKTRATEDRSVREVTGAKETSFRLEDIRRIGIPDWNLVRYED